MPSLSGIGASAVQLGGSVTLVPAPNGVQLRSDPGNANGSFLYVGYNNLVTAGGIDATNGYILQPGDAYFVPPSKIKGSPQGNPAIGHPVLNNIWVIGSTAGLKIYWDIL